MRHRRIIFIMIILALIIAGCGDNGETSSNNSLRGNVIIEAPNPKSIVYSETIFVQGTAEGLVDNRFWLDIRQDDDTLQTSIMVTVQDDNTWGVEIVHGYAGEPSDFVLVARPENADIVDVYSVQMLTIADLQYRPDGIYGRIVSPTVDATIGGDAVLISGRVSGIAIDSLVVRLILDDDETYMGGIDATQSSLLDEVLWDAEISLLDIVPNMGDSGMVMGTIELSYFEGADRMTLDRVDVLIGSVAG